MAPKLSQFRNAIGILDQILIHLDSESTTSISPFVPKLSDQLFNLLKWPIFDQSAISVLRKLSKNSANGAAENSFCEGVVSIAARLQKSVSIEPEWTEESLTSAVKRIFINCPKKMPDDFSAILSEVAVLALSVQPKAGIDAISIFHSQVLLDQSMSLLSTIIRHLATADSSDPSVESGAELLIQIAKSLRQRSLNEVKSCIPFVKGLEEESVGCRSACLAALKVLHPDHGADAEGSKLGSEI